MSIVDDTALQARIAALEAKLQTAEQERDEWRDAFEKTSWNAGVELLKVEGALKQRDTRIAALEATLTQIRALPRSHRASTYEHLGRYEAGPFVRADELDRLLNALPETPKKSD
jgi:SOS-response transcriptional repressor LexA